MARRTRFMTSVERKALANPKPAPVESNLPVWDRKSGDPYNGYIHAPKVDKGMKDGSCNRTACQAPLRGNPQYYMGDGYSDRRLYYCEECAKTFTEVDRRFHPTDPVRCTLDRSTI